MTPEHLKRLRLAADMTQDELARFLGLNHRSQVHFLETGRYQIRGARLILLHQLEKKIRKSNPNLVDKTKQTA